MHGDAANRCANVPLPRRDDAWIEANWVTRAFSVLAEPARSPSWPPTASYAIGGREGERAGADSKQTENALATRRFA